MRIGVDIGGTNLVAGLVDDNFNLVDKVDCPANAQRPDTELVADIISPIRSTHEYMDFYNFILDNRIRIIRQEQWNRVSSRYRDDDLLNINLDYVSEVRNIVEESADYEFNFSMEEFWIRGMSTIIAQTMNTTRQNIDRYVSLGRIKESRTMDKAIYEMLGER